MPDPRMFPVPQGQPEIEHDVLQGLTPKSVAFCRLYAVHQNAEKAARLAAYHPRYGHQLLQDPRIQDAIAYYAAVYASETTYTSDKILHQWSQMASVDIGAVVDDDWSLKPPSQLTADQRAALVGVEVVEKNGKRYAKATFAKAQALEHLGRINKLYADDKAKGEGLSLNITLGQAVHVHGQTVSQSLGHLQIGLTQAPQEDA